MPKCVWEEIEAFSSPSEYKRFIIWIEKSVKEGKCMEIEAQAQDTQDGFKQKRLFECCSSREVWCLLSPDPGYFKGSWRKNS